ncbi:MAG TPA: cupin domain-containing protein [Gaiellaceae bacterium]|nr:cupin domain-containing protein [Gaiellaceae bacterium]
MARVFTREELPHWASTRDTRDRLDLVTDAVPVGATRLRADRVVYHPGDTAAAHYHVGCDHVFVVLAGSGLFYADDERHRLGPGDIAAVAEREVHWFANDTDANFSFVEFWAPPPAETVWVREDDT